MLKLIHLLDSIVVVSNFWERERLIIELLCCHSEFGVDALLIKLFLDVLGIFPVFHLEVSGELTELIVQLVLGDLEWLGALFNIELH